MQELPSCEREFISGFIPVNNFSISDLFDLRESGRLWVCNAKDASKARVWNFSLMRRPNKSGEGAVGMDLLQRKGKLFMRVR
jgi:hypothetical protein